MQINDVECALQHSPKKSAPAAIFGIIDDPENE
jgi:hypothetical protein